MNELNVLALRAKRGEAGAFEELFRRVRPRIHTTHKLFDARELNTREDIDAITDASVWKAICKFDLLRHKDFLTYACQYARWEVSWAIRNAKKSVRTFSLTDCYEDDGPRDQSYESWIQFQHNFALDAGVDPQTILMVIKLEQALKQEPPIVQEIYRLKKERPWVSVDELSGALGVSAVWARKNLYRLVELAADIRSCVDRSLECIDREYVVGR